MTSFPFQLMSALETVSQIEAVKFSCRDRQTELDCSIELLNGTVLSSGGAHWQLKFLTQCHEISVMMPGYLYFPQSRVDYELEWRMDSLEEELDHCYLLPICDIIRDRRFELFFPIFPCRGEDGKLLAYFSDSHLHTNMEVEGESYPEERQPVIWTMGTKKDGTVKFCGHHKTGEYKVLSKDGNLNGLEKIPMIAHDRGSLEHRLHFLVVQLDWTKGNLGEALWELQKMAHLAHEIIQHGGLVFVINPPADLAKPTSALFEFLKDIEE